MKAVAIKDRSRTSSPGSCTDPAIISEFGGLTRTEKKNPYNYSESQLEVREITIKKMKEMYGDEICEGHLEWIFDYCTNTPKEEIHEMLERSKTGSKKYQAIPQTLYGMEVVDKDED